MLISLAIQEAANDSADEIPVTFEMDDEAVSVNEENEILKGIDSSDEEETTDAFQSNKAVISLDQKTEKKIHDNIKKNKKNKGDKMKPGVIYLGKIPHGFFEREMKAYFSQFGDVTRLRLSRNRKVWIHCMIKNNVI